MGAGIREKPREVFEKFCTHARCRNPKVVVQVQGAGVRTLAHSMSARLAFYFPRDVKQSKLVYDN